MILSAQRDRLGILKIRHSKANFHYFCVDFMRVELNIQDLIIKL